MSGSDRMCRLMAYITSPGAGDRQRWPLSNPTPGDPSRLPWDQGKRSRPAPTSSAAGAGAPSAPAAGAGLEHSPSTSCTYQVPPGAGPNIISTVEWHMRLTA